MTIAISQVPSTTKYVPEYHSIRTNKDSLFGGKTDEFSVSKLNQASASTTDTNKNAVNINTGNVYSFGSINGKPLNFSMDKSGYFNTNFSPVLHGISTPGSAVTPYEMAAATQFSSYTEDEHRQENKLIGRLNDLIDLSQGKMSMEEFNSRETFPYVSSSLELLQQLGINANRTFTVNGADFKFSDGSILKN